jgi:hypothetical protein
MDSLNMRRAALCFCGLLLVAIACPAQVVPECEHDLYWIESLSKDNARLCHYTNLKTESVQIRGITIWQRKLDITDPLGKIYWVKPDLTLELLREGYAQLDDPQQSVIPYQETENDARSVGKGMWSGDRATTAGSPFTESEITNYVHTLGKFLLDGIAFWGGLSAVLITIGLAWRYLHRRPIPILLLGVDSSGKTWLWASINDPNISHQDFLSLRTRTTVTQVRVAEKRKPMGRYELRPVYIDTPGGSPGSQTMELLKRRRFSYPKCVWVIVLSTTRQDVNYSNSESEKIAVDYIAEQLGYLALPLGMLMAPRTPKPEMVIAAISKFDLFSMHDPTDPLSSQAQEQLSSLFSKHTERLSEACKRAGVPFGWVTCSALKHWKTDRILTYIEKALFA